MRTEQSSYGYRRSRQVPAHAGTEAKPCRKCSLWFAARPRERLCDGCVPQKVRNQRFALDPHWATKAGVKLPGAAGQKARKSKVQQPGYATESALLGATFGRPVPLWRGMAMEAAACLDGKRTANAWKASPLAPRELANA